MSRPSIRSSLTLALLLPLTLAVGCYANEEADGDQEFRTTAGCITCGVNSNSPALNDSVIPEVLLDGALGSTEVTVIGIEDPEGSMHTLTVVDDEFAVELEDVTLKGADLIGWTIKMDSPLGTYEVEIHDHDFEDSFVDGAAPISVYALRYESLLDPGELLNVCPGVAPEATAITLIGGETYDREEKTVIANQSDWVTLACADEALFKMKRMNYGPNQDFKGSGSPATVDQRQATLKMITADYCGGGQSFTQQGTTIVWHDTSGTVGPAAPPANAELEAYWTHEGALCLDTPRLVDHDVVDEECFLPACSTIDLAGAGVVWTTHTP